MFLYLLLGLFVGSFLNVVIYRIPKGESILGRSYCDNCKRKLAWYDLIPLLSFLILKGKCRFCKRQISWQIPFIEALTGLLFATYYLKVQTLDLNFFLTLIIISGLIAVFFIDLRHGIIPNRILLPLFLAGIALNLDNNLTSFLFSSIFSFLFFFLIYFFSRGTAMGFGDVKLAGVLGVILGFPLSVFSFYLSFLTGGLASLILVLWGKKKLRGDTIPFGPFLSLGGLICIFLGNLLVLLWSSFLPY